LADEALRAFLEGLGAASLEIPPERAAQTMGLMGEVLREALLGAIELLRLRAGFKREFYIPGTSIAPVENNPLKYAADLDDALMRLFGRKTSAYLPPVQATRQAFEDVAAHQVAMVAGLEAAVASLLERFAPERLEERLGTKSMLDGLLPLNRKAKFWDLFTREYQQIAQDARDDFNRAFGQNFARAYLRQIAGLGKAGFGERKADK
jgi:type VI secretion system FHA domain protein